MARVKIQKNPVKETVESILKKQNKSYADWEKEIVNKKKLEVMADEDKEWTRETVREASMDLIMEEVIKNNKKVETNNKTDFHSNSSTNVN
uniref:DUF5415 family protein n=1 Tax=Carnobacterium sp. TaxID=48221 RepID=UPI00344C888B